MPRTFSDPIQIGPLLFNSGVPDASGILWYCDQLEGWDTSSKPNLEYTSFGYSDGVAVSGRAPKDPKFIEFGGAIVSVDNDRTAAEMAWRRLLGVLDENSTLRVVRNGPVPERLDTRLYGEVAKPKDIGHAFRFHTTLMAPWPFKEGATAKGGVAGVFTGGSYYRTYPRKYPLTYKAADVGSESALPTSVTVVNEGNAAGYPIISVTGPLLPNSWYLTVDSTNEQQSFTLAIGSGQTLRIDERNQMATLEGQVVDYYLRGDWLYFPAQSNSTIRLVTTEPNNAARLTVETYDTWK